MKTYKVRVHESKIVDIIVDAESVDEAEDLVESGNFDLVREISSSAEIIAVAEDK
jgi:hypothetical protein